MSAENLQCVDMLYQQCVDSRHVISAAVKLPRVRALVDIHAESVDALAHTLVPTAVTVTKNADYKMDGETKSGKSL